MHLSAGKQNKQNNNIDPISHGLGKIILPAGLGADCDVTCPFGTPTDSTMWKPEAPDPCPDLERDLDIIRCMAGHGVCTGLCLVKYVSLFALPGSELRRWENR